MAGEQQERNKKQGSRRVETYVAVLARRGSGVAHRELPPPVEPTILHLRILESLAGERPVRITERQPGRLRVIAEFDDPIPAARAAVAVRSRLLWDAAKTKRVPPVNIGIASTSDDAARLADRAPAGTVLLSDEIAEVIGDSVIVARGSDSDRTSAVELVAVRDDAPQTHWTPSLEGGLAVLGAAAGLAAWVALVGGFTMWARFNAAHVPAIEGVSIVPHSVLLAQGTRTLAVPLILGMVAALFAYAVATRWPRQRRASALWNAVGAVGRARKLGLDFVVGLTLIALPLLVFAFRYGFGEDTWSFAVLVALSLVAVGALAFAVIGISARHWLGLVVLAVIAGWSGIAGFVLELGSRSPRLDHATLQLVGHSSSDVLFITRTGETVYVAEQDPRAGNACRIRVLPVSSVADLRIGGPGGTELCPAGSRQAIPPGTTVLTVTAPGTTVTVSRGTVTIAPATVTAPNETVTYTSPPTTITRIETATPRPAGAHRVDGVWSIPVGSVQAPARLQISAPHYDRAPLIDTHPLHVWFRITDTRGFVVEGARVYVGGARAIYFRHSRIAMSREDGRATVVLLPTSRLPFGKGVRVALLARAWNPAGGILGVVSTRRFVDLVLGPRM